MIPLNKSVIENTVHRAYSAFQTTVGLSEFTPGQKNQYNEIIFKTFAPPVEFLAHVTLNPSEVRLNELGWQKDDVELIIRVPHIELRRVLLAEDTGELNFNSDWRIVIGGKQYEICKIHAKEPFIQDVSLYVWIGGRNPNGRTT